LQKQAEADGSNEYNNFQPGSLNTTKQIIQDLKDIDIVFNIGDLSYANGYLSQWDQFTAQIEPIASTVPYMTARFVLLCMCCIFVCLLLFFVVSFSAFTLCAFSGNHERDWPDTGSFYGNLDSGGECGVLAQTMFYVPAENREKFWYNMSILSTFCRIYSTFVLFNTFTFITLMDAGIYHLSHLFKTSKLHSHAPCLASNKTNLTYS